MVGVNFDIFRGSISLPINLSISYYFFVVNNFFREHNNTKKAGSFNIDIICANR